MIHLKVALSTLLLSTVAATGTAFAHAQCDLDSIRAITPKDAVVDGVRDIAGPVAHCEVLGHTITQNPGPNRVDWSLTLPDRNFGGRYFFIGQGAACGQII